MCCTRIVKDFLVCSCESHGGKQSAAVGDPSENDNRAQLIEGLAAKGSAALIGDKYVVPQRWKTTYGHGRSQINRKQA